MENRLQNLLWTVSEDYNCDVKINPADLQKSPEIAFYNMVLQGAFQKNGNVTDGPFIDKMLDTLYLFQFVVRMIDIAKELV